MSSAIKSSTATLVTSLALLCAPLAGAHHSYGSFDTETSFTLTGTITEVEWTNPHILLSVSDGQKTYRVEWVTITGAERTSVAREQFTLGETISLVGSRHRDPERAIVALVKKIDLPADRWQWTEAGSGPVTVQ